MELTDDQVKDFDAITRAYGEKARIAYEANSGSKKAVEEAVGGVFAEQDKKIQALVGKEQYSVYAREMKIEREGREKHNMTLIREELKLDSTQAVQYDLANEAFYTLLIDNHDNYHGKPEVYEQYYAEIDNSRQAAFKKLMNAEQYDLYLGLVEKYQIGKSEAD